MDTSWKKIIVGFLLLVSVGSLTWGIAEYHEIKKIEGEYLSLKKRAKKLDEKRARLNGDLIDAKEKEQEAIDSANTIVNNSADSKEQQDINITMKKNITSAFKGLYNYTPDTFSQRKNKVKNLLSNALNRQYFDSNSVKYGDSSNVESRLEKIDIYTKTVQGSKLQAMVATNYSSKYESSEEWNSGNSMYKVTYDSKSNRIEQIEQIFNKTE